MKEYFRIMLGAGSLYAGECYTNNFIGAGFLGDIDLTGKLPEYWRNFNEEFIPTWLEQNPEKTKVAAGLACGMLWTVAKGLKKGDIVLCPNGMGSYYVGEITGDYEYHARANLPHQRPVRWFPQTIERAEMSDPLRKSVGSIGTTCDITKYADEIEKLISGKVSSPIIATNEPLEDPSVFALEKHLEDFLVQNWKQTELGKHYDIYENDGEIIGQQYPTDTGRIDILAISKDKKELLVVELKKGRASDYVVGQVQRYMGYVLEELAEEGQMVKG